MCGGVGCFREGGTEGTSRWEGLSEGLIRNSAAAPGQNGGMLAVLGGRQGSFACGILKNVVIPLRNSPLAACRKRVSRKVVERYILGEGEREKRASQRPKLGPESSGDMEEVSLIPFRRLRL